MGTLGLSPEAKAARDAKKAALAIPPPVIVEEPPRKKHKRGRRGKNKLPVTPPPPKKKKIKIKQVARPAKKVVLETFQKLFPKLFNEYNPLPLKLGIINDIRDAKIGLTMGTIKLFLKDWTKRREYHLAMIQDDAGRYDLNELCVALVSIRERDFALSQLNPENKGINDEI